MPKYPQHAPSPNSEVVLALQLFYKSSPGIPSFLQLKTNFLPGSACLAVVTSAVVTSSFNVSMVMVPSTLWTKRVLPKKNLCNILLDHSEKSVMINTVHGSSCNIITLISIKFQRDLLDLNQQQPENMQRQTYSK